MTSLSSQLPYFWTLQSPFLPIPHQLSLNSHLALPAPITFPFPVLALVPAVRLFTTLWLLAQFPSCRCVCLQVHPLHISHCSRACFFSPKEIFPLLLRELKSNLSTWIVRLHDLSLSFLSPTMTLYTLTSFSSHGTASVSLIVLDLTSSCLCSCYFFVLKFLFHFSLSLLPWPLAYIISTC